MQKTNQDIINNVVWKACDTFRGTMGSDEYKEYIVTMVFVKYLSDFYKEKMTELKAKYGDNQDRISKSLKREKFVLDESCTFEYLLKHKESAEVGEVINKALERIEEDNKEKLEGIFRNVDFNSEVKLGKTKERAPSASAQKTMLTHISLYSYKERNSILKHLLEDFSDSRLDLRPSMLENNDVIGDAYEFLIAYFASDAGKKGGEFFTPSAVSTLLAKLVEAKEGDRIYDPTCGSGSLLIKASKEVKSKNFAIYGQESNGQTHALSNMNMF